MEELISTLGFPITAAIGLAYYSIIKDKANREDVNKIIDSLREDNKLDRELYRETISKFDEKLDKFSIAIENNNNRLKVIEGDIKTIKEKVGV